MSDDIRLKRFEEYRKYLEELEEKRIMKAKDILNKIADGECTLFRVWYFTNDNRYEECRVVAEDFDDVISFILREYIDPAHLDEIEYIDDGIMWSNCDIDECRELMNCENPCENCYETPIAGFSIEEIEDPTIDDIGFKTIYGTNELYIVKDDVVEKADDWSPLTTFALRLSELFGRN